MSIKYDQMKKDINRSFRVVTLEEYKSFQLLLKEQIGVRGMGAKNFPYPGMLRIHKEKRNYRTDTLAIITELSKLERIQSKVYSTITALRKAEGYDVGVLSVHVEMQGGYKTPSIFYPEKKSSKVWVGSQGVPGHSKRMKWLAYPDDNSKGWIVYKSELHKLESRRSLTSDKTRFPSDDLFIYLKNRKQAIYEGYRKLGGYYTALWRL